MEKLNWVQVAQSCLTLYNPLQLYSPWNFSPGQNTGVGSCSLLQIFPTQRSNPGLLHCRRLLYQLNHKGSPRILEYVAYPFCSGSSWLRNRIGVSCIAGGFFTSWATKEAHGEAKIQTLSRSSGEAGIQTQLQVWLWAYASEPPHNAACYIDTLCSSSTITISHFA